VKNGEIAQVARWKPNEVQDEHAAHDKDELKSVSEKKQA
jgi:hypothetical protein